MDNKIINGRIFKYAMEAVRASQAGKSSYKPTGTATPQTFNLVEGGYCLRFVRQVFETALNLAPKSWKYSYAKAKDALRAMYKDGKQVGDKTTDTDDLKVGDIIGITTGTYGHIAIYMGKINGIAMVAENTSSASRGKPLRAGTKLTPYAQLKSRVTGIHRLYPEEDK